ncbi:MAG: NUDIX hydrolase [Desulfosarcina sp.]|nr:NUDIX hydrolase [Desulfobacterales bacterium]
MQIHTAPKEETLIPSATVILLREGACEVETLLLRRNLGADPFAGAWVFPGGTIEASDGPLRKEEEWPPAARQAAVRELCEEAGLELAAEHLVPFSRWISPTSMPRRFRTWFFLAAAPAGTIRLSPQEVSAYRWMTPRQVLAAHQSQTMTLFPPTWVSLNELTTIETVSRTLSTFARRPPAVYNPRVRRVGQAMCFFYEEDVAYGDLDADRPGPRHRLWALAEGWRYERARRVTFQAEEE